MVKFKLMEESKYMKTMFLEEKVIYIFIAILVFFGLYLTTLYNYLLFHSISELFSTVIAFGIFVVAWNSRKFIENNYLLFIGIAYLFVGSIDFIHTLAYKGMGVFKDSETNLATQLWIGARYMESISLLVAPLTLRRRLSTNFIFFIYCFLSSLLLFSIFYWEIFPICFVEEKGLTHFKKVSEYLISFILLISILFLWRKREEFDINVFKWIAWSIILTIFSELSFTFYSHAYGLSNLVGHYFKILSFYFIYKAIIETGISKPFNLLFRNLKLSEERLEIMVQERTEELSRALKELEDKSSLTNANNAILNLFAKKTSRKEFLDDLINLIEEWTKCHCVGIRILDKNQFIPYESYKGFSHEFWKSESFLCLKFNQCICTRVAKDDMELFEKNFTTPFGSFYNNSLQKFWISLSGEERSKYRGVCMESGFASIAIIPIKYHDKIFGIIHLADEREGMVPVKKVEFLEAVSPLVGETINRFNLESELNRNYEIQKAMNSLLRLSLEDFSLDEFLRETLNILLSNPWIPQDAGGCIFLAKDKQGILSMKAQYGLPDSVQKGCLEVQFGKCLCGKAISNRKIQFTNSQDDIHEFKYNDVKPHSHYHVPILFKDRILGLITLYLGEEERPGQEKESFFEAVANTLSIIILKKEWEEVLRESEERLRVLSSQLLTVQENERKEIARDLHDSIGQMLSAIKFKIEDLLQQKNEKDINSVEANLQSLLPLIRESIEEVRRIQMNLRPSILDDLGIIATLKWFSREFKKVYSNIQIDEEFEIKEEEIPQSIKIVIYRIVQEGFNNIAKHSGANFIHLLLKKIDSRIILQIEDNGKGFDFQKLFSMDDSLSGFGLNSMRERTELSGGTFNLESWINKGTVIKASWPI